MLRAILWAKYCTTSKWSDLTISLLYYLPQANQFSTFSLLVLLYASLVGGKKTGIRCENWESIV